jgi:hypothetical protein
VNRKDLMNFRQIVLALICLGAIGCVSSEVFRLSGQRFQARAPNCPVKFFPSTTPDYPWQDIASVSTKCLGRDACIAELRQKACQEGGDTVYDFKDGRQGEYTFVVATVGIRKAASAKKVVQPDNAAATNECDPPCSPGYRCNGRECKALCNPPCEAGMICSPKRVCEPAALGGGN